MSLHAGTLSTRFSQRFRQEARPQILRCTAAVGDTMREDFRLRPLLATYLCLFITVAICSAQESKVLGEVRFEGATKVEKDAGVWIDGNYMGYLKELHGDKKVMLIPGEHEISVRESGYDDFLKKVVVEPGQVQTIDVKLHPSPHSMTPDVTAELKLTVKPGRAAVFLDGSYVGHASEFGACIPCW